MPLAFGQQWHDAALDVLAKVRRLPVCFEGGFVDVLLIENEPVGSSLDRLARNWMHPGSARVRARCCARIAATSCPRPGIVWY